VLGRARVVGRLGKLVERRAWRGAAMAVVADSGRCPVVPAWRWLDLVKTLPG
jgi:hypothetical protein